ncbi:hypothetical protein [Dolichospermum sp. UHCC 0406]|nr:hypothetical protein [Dolichospermum sp. UHCC 0406]
MLRPYSCQLLVERQIFSPITHYQLPITNYQLPITNYLIFRNKL